MQNDPIAERRSLNASRKLQRIEAEAHRQILATHRGWAEYISASHKPAVFDSAKTCGFVPLSQRDKF